MIPIDGNQDQSRIEMEQSPDRRNQQAQERWMRDLIDQVVRENISVRSLKKNGEPWSVWLERNITLDRILLVALMLYTMGGEVHQVKGDLEEAQRRTEIMQQQHERINERLSDIEGRQKLEAAAELNGQELTAETKGLATVSVKQNAEIAGRLRAQETRIQRLTEAVNNLLLRHYNTP